MDPKVSPVEVFSNKFEQLVKHNNEIITSMKQSTEHPKGGMAGGNLVSKTMAPKSEYNNSPTTSPTSRSFISENPDK